MARRTDASESATAVRQGQRLSAKAIRPMIVLTTGAKAIVRVNPSFTEQLGYSAEDLQRRPFLDWIDPDDREELAQVMSSGGRARARIRANDGEWVLFDWNARLNKGNTAILGLIATDAPTVRRTPLDSKPGFGSTILETLDAMARIVEAKNPGLRCSILLIDEDDEGQEFITRGAGPSLPPEYNAAVEGLQIGPAVGSCGTASFWNVPVVVENIAEDPLWRDLKGVAAQAGVAACWSFPVPATSGNVLGAIALYNDEPSGPTDSQMNGLELAARMVGLAIERDILEEKLRHAAQREKDQLAQELKSAEMASRLKSEFLANMSHEIRTPMTAILGYSEYLKNEDATDAERRHALDTICENGNHLLELINNILDLSKIESGNPEIEHTKCCPMQVMVDVAALMNVSAKARGLSLSHELRGSVPEYIVSDPTRLKQILVNLVGNAIKFTEAGDVRMTAQWVDCDGDGTPMIEVEVIDTGIGMTEAQVARLFQPFTQADETMTRRFGGTGLGLSISQRLAELLGGDVSVQSKLGEGSTFRLRVAARPHGDSQMITSIANMEVEGSERKEPEAAVKIEGRLLLAEDNPVNQHLIAFMLDKAGAHVTVAENGIVAVDKALAARAEGHAFDLILMDMQMPELDGYGATMELRENGWDGPIIAITAHAMSDDRARCIAAGCDDFTTKPVDRKELTALVRQHLQNSQSSV